MTPLLLTLEEREWIANNAVIEVGTNEGRSFRIANMKVIMKRLREQRFRDGLSSIISIMPIREDVKKVHSYTFSVFHDRQFDVRYGIYQRLNKQGEPTFQRLELRETMDLDLTRDDDALFWLVARLHPTMEGSPFSTRPYFKLFDSSVQILGERAKMNEILKATKRVDQMDIKKKVYFLRYLGVTLQESYNSEILDGLLFQKINANPFDFNNKYESSSRSIHEIFATALTLGVISHNIEKGYSFNGIKLGNTDFDTISFITKDKVVFSAILDKLGSMDYMLKKIEERSKTEKKESVEPTNENSNPIDEFV